MKKNIEYVSIDSSTALWLKENLPSGELKNGITDLLTGENSSLMLEISEESAAFFEKDMLHCGELTINLKSHKVARDNKEIALTPKEFDILLFLAQNRGEVFTKEQIYKAVWDNDYLLDDSNIMAFIRKLRKKIEPNPDDPEYILTIWGVGYKFNDNF